LGCEEEAKRIGNGDRVRHAAHKRREGKRKEIEETEKRARER
jgi:hypothetical protein